MLHFWWILLIFLAASLILCKLSRTLNFAIKYACLCFAYTCVTIVSCTVYQISPKAARRIFRMVEQIFSFRVQLEDEDYFKSIEEPVVIVSNHQSLIDLSVGFMKMPYGTVPVVKKCLMYVPIFGFFLWLYGTIFIDRSKGGSAIDTLRKAAIEMKKKKRSVMMFPEGTRQQKDRVTAFKKGAFHLAVNAQVPIVPVVIGNYRNIIDRHNRSIDGGVIRVKPLRAIPTVGLTTEDVDALTQRVQKLISDAFDEDFRNHSGEYTHLAPLKDD